MACTYCYQNHKTKNKMSFDTAKKFIDSLLNDEYDCVNTKNTITVIFDFIGGEPLMEIELIDQIIYYTISKMVNLKHPWLPLFKINIGSNGILYNNPKVQEFFTKYGSFTGLEISIDGNKELHDSCRVDLNGNGTYDRAIAAVRQHKKLYGHMPDTKMTIAPDNVSFIFDAVVNLINEGYTSVMLNCVYEEGWNYSHAAILYNQLKKVSDYIIKNNLYNKIYIRMLDEDNFCPLSEENNDNWCGGIADSSLSINYKGNFYPCIRYMESSLNGTQDQIIIGDVENGYLATDIHKKNYEKISNITRRSQSDDKCFYCPIATGCGWCSAYNYEKFGIVNKRATYICCMHQAMSLANVYYWNNLYKYLHLDKHFIMYIPKEWALNIIDINEYNYLKSLSEEEFNKNG